MGTFKIIFTNRRLKNISNLLESAKTSRARARKADRGIRCLIVASQLPDELALKL